MVNVLYNLACRLVYLQWGNVMNENKEEYLEFLSELLSDVYNEQNRIRQEMQIKNDEIRKMNQRIKDIHADKKSSDCMFSISAAKEVEKKEEYLSKIEKLQTQVFDMQKRILSLQKRVDKLKNIGRIINQAESRHEKEQDRTSVCEKLRILETQELERKRISMELHDTTVQNLTTLVHKTELCTKLIDIDSIRAKLELQTMTDTIRNTINELRGIIYDLRPMSIDDLGLVVTVQRFIKQMEVEDENSIPITFKVNNEEVKILPVINLTLFRIIQEAYNNTKKHAKADHFYITITYEKKEIEVEIKDDGIGFQLALFQKENRQTNKNFGLSIMKERVELLTGTMNVVSGKSKGTDIIIKVPIVEEDEYDTH